MCGWLKDKSGVSWQIFLTILGEMLLQGKDNKKDAINSERVMEAMLQMKKLGIEGLKKAYTEEQWKEEK